MDFVAEAQAKVSGATDPVFTYILTGSLISGDMLTGSLTRTPGETLGTYPIMVGTLSAGGNYAITYIGANLTINSIGVVTITVDSKSKTYGNADPVFTYIASGLQGGD